MIDKISLYILYIILVIKLCDINSLKYVHSLFTIDETYCYNCPFKTAFTKRYPLKSEVLTEMEVVTQADNYEKK